MNVEQVPHRRCAHVSEFGESALSFQHVGPSGWIQALRLGGKACNHWVISSPSSNPPRLL